MTAVKKRQQILTREDSWCKVRKTINYKRSTQTIKGELNPKIDFSSFQHLGIVEQLYEGFFKLLAEQFKKIDVL